MFKYCTKCCSVVNYIYCGQIFSHRGIIIKSGTDGTALALTFLDNTARNSDSPI